MNRKIQPSVQGTSCLHGSWESKACHLLRQVVSLSSKLRRKYYNPNQITACLLGRNLKPIPFSPGLKLLDDSNTQIESHSVSALGLGVGVEGEGAELQARGSTVAANPPGHCSGSSCTASWLCQAQRFL